MMKRLFILLVGLFWSQIAMPQNLIPNGDFENYIALPDDFCQANRATGWNNVNGMYFCAPYASPDYYHSMGWTPTTFGPIAPYSGDGQMGFGTYLPNSPNYREYISVHLISNLVIGQQYQISYYLTNGLGTYNTFSTNNIGINFSMSPLSQPVSSVISVIPQIEITDVTYIINQWQYYSFVFTATNAFSYVTFGNFRDDANTSISPTGSMGAYYYIDKIELIPFFPDFSVTGDSVICAGDSARLTASGSASYAWAEASNPGSIISNQPSIWVSPTATTTYLAYGHNDTIAYTVTVFSPVSLHLGNDTTLCYGETLDLNATNPNASYLWQDHSTNPIYTVTQPGTYWVAATNSCGTKNDTITVHYDSLFPLNLGNDTTLCQGVTLLLDATTPSASYVWQDNSASSSYTVTQSGTYWVRVTKSCTVTDSITVHFIPLPILNFGNDTTLCPNETLTLDATNPGASYLWQDHSSTSSFTITQPGVYWATATNNCGTISDTISVAYHALTALDLGSDTTLCEGEILTLDATTQNASYLWQDNSSNPTYTVSHSGTYWVNVTTNCNVSDSITIDYIPLPRSNFGNDTTLCQGKTLILEPTPNSVCWWQDSITAPSFAVTQTGTYWVSVTNSCGVANDTLNVEFKDCYCTLYIPNAFRPDGDNLNDRFAPVSTCDFAEYQLLIFNRWGEIVFETTNPTDSWGGSYNGSPAAFGVYVYVVNYRFGQDISARSDYGNVYLVR